MDWMEIYGAEPCLEQFSALEGGGARLLVRRGYESALEEADVWGEGGDVVGFSPGGREPHPVLALGSGEHVLMRNFRRGGAMRRINRDRYFVGHRAFEELRTTEHARHAGVRVPTLIAAREVTRRFGYEAALLVRWIAGARELAACLPVMGGSERSDVARRAAREIAKMHAAGVAHPDLNLRNLLVVPPGTDQGGTESGAEEGQPDLLIIDFDRARIFRGPVPGARRAHDLRRLARSARKLDAPLTPDDWAAFREGYGADWPLAGLLG